MTETWPVARVVMAPDPSPAWPRAIVLGSTPVVVAAITGTMLWLAGSVGAMSAASLAETLPAWPLTIAAALGGRVDGEFVNISTTGAWGVAFAVPVVAGLLVGRWLRSGGLRTYGLGLAASSGLHLLVAVLLGMVVAFDPTSFETVAVTWVPVSSFVTAALVWGTAWVVREREATRMTWLGLATCVALGGGVGVAVAVREGLDPALLPAAGLVGGLFGPNLAGLAMVWSSGVEAGLVGRVGPEVGSFPAFAAVVGSAVWLVPLVAFAGMIVAAFRARVIGSLAEFRRRSRDVVIGAMLFVPLIVVLGSPRVQTGPSAASEQWLGVDGASWSLVAPVLLLVAVVLVPSLVTSVRAGQTWPSEVIADLGWHFGRVAGRVHGWASTPGGTLQRQVTPNQAAPEVLNAHGPASVPPRVATSANDTAHGVAAKPGGPTWPVLPTDPTWPVQGTALASVAPESTAVAPNPFEDDAPPPVSTVWADVAPAAGDPGAAPASTASARPVAPSTLATAPPTPEPSWRHAPPPSFSSSNVPTDTSSTTEPFPAAGPS